MGRMRWHPPFLLLLLFANLTTIIPEQEFPSLVESEKL